MIPLKDDNPTGIVPFVTAGLIAANLIVFFYMLSVGGMQAGMIVERYAAVPARMFGGVADVKPSSLLQPATSMFLHGSLLHVGGNMLYLWIFGDNIEDALGHFGFLAFYLACGLAGAYAHGLTDTGSSVPMIGASGAVAGVLGAYIVMYPRAGVWTFFFFLFFWRVVKVPALVIIGLWILLQVLNGMAEYGTASGGVAWFAHIGGFLAGAVIGLAAGRKRRTNKGRLLY